MSSYALGRTMIVATVSGQPDTSAEVRCTPHPKGGRQSGRHDTLRVVRGEAQDANLEWGGQLARRFGPTRHSRSSRRPRAHRIPEAGWGLAEISLAPRITCGNSACWSGATKLVSCDARLAVTNGQQQKARADGWLTYRRSAATTSATRIARRWSVQFGGAGYYAKAPSVSYGRGAPTRREERSKFENTLAPGAAASRTIVNSLGHADAVRVRRARHAGAPNLGRLLGAGSGVSEIRPLAQRSRRITRTSGSPRCDRTARRPGAACGSRRCARNAS